jgi:two-component system response regulator FixJ
MTKTASKHPITPASGAAVSLAMVEEVLGLNLAAASERYNQLTRREVQVARLMATGKPNREIAAELAISPKTLDIHRANLMHKLQARTSAQVANLVNLLRVAADAAAMAS